MSIQKTLLILVSSVMVLASCATPPPRQPSMSAVELAARQLPTSTSNKPLQGIIDSSRASTQPLKQVNQVGRVPEVATLSDRTANDFANRVSQLPDSAWQQLQFDWEQADLRMVIETIADGLGMVAVIDPTIGDKVTLRTGKDRNLRKEDLWPFLQLLLSDAGITVEKKGSVYHFKKTGPTIPGALGTANSLSGSTAPEAVQIVPLRYITVDSAVALLTPLVQPQGRIISMPNVNIIGVIASPQRLERISKLLNIVDVDPFLHRGMRLFRLTNSKAMEVQAELEKILRAISGNLPAYQVIGLERINGLLVIAPPGGGFDEVGRWVDILDEKGQSGDEQVFIYRVRNLEAKTLASTLTNVFKVDEKDKIPRPDQPQPPKPSEVQPVGQPGQPPTPQATPTPAVPGSNLLVSAQLRVTLVADDATNSLLIKARPRDYKQLLETIKELDQVPKEVMINVVIAEVTLTKATQFGVDWRAFFGRNNRSFTGMDWSIPSTGIGGTTSTTTTPPGSSTPSAASGLSGFVIDYVAGRINAVLNLIASDNDLRILARPSILVRNNQDATINVGSNEPIITNTQSTVSTTVQPVISNSVQYRDVGITLKVTPRINEDGIINMKIYQEVSKIGALRTTQQLQSFDQRKVETSVVVRDGSAIVIGGLIQNDIKDNRQGVPVLKDVPFMGQLFSSTDLENKRIELVLIIVPEIVNPELENGLLVARFRKRMQAVSALLNDRDVQVEELSELQIEPPPIVQSPMPETAPVTEESATVPATSPQD